MSRKKRYPMRMPRPAGGIRAQGLRTDVAATWWERRWLAGLARMNVGGRLGRGRNYALSGQIVDLKMDGAVVTARVMGARTAPYDVRIVFRRPAGAVRARLVAALRAEPMWVARLLAGELPVEVEALFQRAGFDLFPGAKLGPACYDVTTSCTCPDYANPCKHADAVLVLLGECIARAPGLLVTLRGIPLEELYEA